MHGEYEVWDPPRLLSALDNFPNRYLLRGSATISTAGYLTTEVRGNWKKTHDIVVTSFWLYVPLLNIADEVDYAFLRPAIQPQPVVDSLHWKPKNP